MNVIGVTPDELALAAIRSGAITVDTDAGIIIRDGRRAEHVHVKTGYGRVVVARPQRWAMAHRVIWIAANGIIPARLEINHANLHRWDNRLANLEVVLPEGNQRHWRGQWYARVPGPEWLEFVAAVREDAEPEEYDPYGYTWLQRMHH